MRALLSPLRVATRMIGAQNCLILIYPQTHSTRPIVNFGLLKNNLMQRKSLTNLVKNLTKWLSGMSGYIDERMQAIVSTTGNKARVKVGFL